MALGLLNPEPYLRGLPQFCKDDSIYYLVLYHVRADGAIILVSRYLMPVERLI
jgi:hypothetical protein